MKRKIALIFSVIFLAACGSTTADTVGLHYNDGPFEGESFERLIEPGSGQQFLGPADKLIRIPINQREYTFCAEVRPEPDKPGCDAPPIMVTAKGGAELGFSGGVTFMVNTGSEEITREFYEKICRKFDCTSKEGWAEMLRVNMRGPIEDALQEEVRDYSVDAIYAGVPAEGENTSEDEALSTLTKVSEALAASLKETINLYAGGNYFCGPGFDRSQPDECPDFEFIITEVTPSPEVKAAFDANVASRQRVIDARNNAEAEVATAEGKRKSQEALGDLFSIPGYIDYLRVLALQDCAKNSNCTLIVNGSDTSNVNVNTGRSTTEG